MGEENSAEIIQRHRDNMCTVFMCKFPAVGSETQTHEHRGVEIVVSMEGQVGIFVTDNLGVTSYRSLKTNDVFTVRPTIRHKIVGEEKGSRVLLINLSKG